MSQDIPTVLHICSIKGRGGTGYMAARLCRLLRDRGVRVIVAACEGSKMEERAREAGIPLLEGLRLRRGFRPVDLWHDVALIRDCIRREKVDIVHAWHSIEYWTAATAAVDQPVRLVRSRGIVSPIKGHLVNAMIHGRTAALHVTCGAILERYRESGLDIGRVRVISDGVDLGRFAPGHDGGMMRREWELSPDGLVIGCVARLEPIKGHCHLFEALRIVKGRVPEVRLVLAGDGSLRQELEILAANCGVLSHIRFLGVRGDIPDILNACDCFALASVGSEGSSRGTMEALAAGLPVVSTTVGTLPEIVTPEVGFTVPPANPDAMAEALLAILEHPERRAAMAVQARARAEAEYNELEFARKIHDMYTDAMAFGVLT